MRELAVVAASESELPTRRDEASGDSSVVHPAEPGSSRVFVGTVVLLAACGAAVVHEFVPWISAFYLCGLVAGPALLWWVARCAAWPSRWRWLAAVLVVVGFVRCCRCRG